jgi:hypothetical protein
MNTIRRSSALAALVLGLMGSSALSAESIQIKTIYNFNNVTNVGGLTSDDRGNLYGESSVPPNIGSFPSSGGSVFSLTPPSKSNPNWNITALHSFTGPPDGTGNVSIVYSNGKIYGTTDYGGLFPNNGPVNGPGIIFSIDGKIENILHQFCQVISCVTDRGRPYELAVENSIVYFLASDGIYKLTPPTKGQSVWIESLIQGGVGYHNILVYSNTIYIIGTQNSQNMLLKFTPPTRGQTSWTRTVLYTFADASSSSLTPDNKGGFYGTSIATSVNQGTVFHITPPRRGQSVWTNTLLYTFKGGPNDGSNPKGKLIIDNKGSLYGITSGGGNGGLWFPFQHGFELGNSGGTIFKLNPPVNGNTIWSEIVYKFCPIQTGNLYYEAPPPYPNCIDGAVPSSLISYNGTMYGSTIWGGSFGEVPFGGYGTIFQITPHQHQK